MKTRTFQIAISALAFCSLPRTVWTQEVEARREEARQAVLRFHHLHNSYMHQSEACLKLQRTGDSAATLACFTKAEGIYDEIRSTLGHVVDRHINLVAAQDEQILSLQKLLLGWQNRPRITINRPGLPELVADGDLIGHVELRPPTIVIAPGEQTTLEMSFIPHETTAAPSPNSQHKEYFLSLLPQDIGGLRIQPADKKPVQIYPASNGAQRFIWIVSASAPISGPSIVHLQALVGSAYSGTTATFNEDAPINIPIQIDEKRSPSVWESPLLVALVTALISVPMGLLLSRSDKWLDRRNKKSQPTSHNNK